MANDHAEKKSAQIHIFLINRKQIVLLMGNRRWKKVLSVIEFGGCDEEKSWTAFTT